jgi:long-chain fatty acid transport protein
MDPIAELAKASGLPLGKPGAASAAWSSMVKRYGFTPKMPVGIELYADTQSFSIRGVGTLAPLTQTSAGSGGSELPGHLSGNGSERSYGAGLKLGAHFQWTPTLSLGLMAQSKIVMSELSDYSDLLPSGGNFDIPADLKLGLSWRFLEHAVISIDTEYIFYSDIEALGNSGQNLNRCPTTGQGGTDLSACLGGANGAGLGWKNVPVYKFGLDWQVGHNWNLRGGFSFGDQPVGISEATNNLLTPYLNESTYTFGFSRAIGTGKELNFAFMYTEEESHHEPNAFDPSQLIYYDHSEFELELSYGWRF